MMADVERVLVLGASGGVGSAFLSLLDQHPTARSIFRHVRTIFIADGRPNGHRYYRDPRLSHPITICVDCASDIRSLVCTYDVDLVIDVSDIETRLIVAVCDDLGVNFIGTGYQVWPWVYEEKSNPRACILERAQEIFSLKSRHSKSSTMLLCSGMNPGVVNAISECSIRCFGSICRAFPSVDDLSLYALYFVEDDNTHFSSSLLPGEFPMTWSPSNALNELLEDRTGYMSCGNILWIEKRPAQTLYTTLCFDKRIRGMLVPHEEVVTIGQKYPSLKVGFIYSIVPEAHRLLVRNPHRCRVEWSEKRLYPPYTTAISGSDTVGVTLCSKQYGEFWMGYRNRHVDAFPFHTNATLMQVAAGIYAGLATAPCKSGLLLVEDLNYAQYLSVVDEFLGPRLSFWNADARPQEFYEQGLLLASGETCSVDGADR